MGLFLCSPVNAAQCATALICSANVWTPEGRFYCCTAPLLGARCCCCCCRERAMLLWSLDIFGPLSACTSSEVSGLFLQLQLLSVMMLYFLNQLYPPVLSSPTLHLALLTLRSSNCNFSISARPHRKCIHPNNHMFSNTQVAINDV